MTFVFSQARDTEQRLLADLHRFESSSQHTAKQLSRCTHQRETVSSGLQSMKDSLQFTSDRYVFLQQLRDYIAALCDCLQDKTAIVEELEEHLRRTREQRAGSTRERERVLLMRDVEMGQGCIAAGMQGVCCLYVFRHLLPPCA